MAKIGTAHIEIKPVLNEAALGAIVQRVEDAIADAVARGVARGARAKSHDCPVCPPGTCNTKTTSVMLSSPSRPDAVIPLNRLNDLTN